MVPLSSFNTVSKFSRKYQIAFPVSVTAGPNTHMPYGLKIEPFREKIFVKYGELKT
jgi:hypothetical protein